MKYLKSYKLFESISNDVLKDIEDILLDLNENIHEMTAYVAKTDCKTDRYKSLTRPIVGGEDIYVVCIEKYKSVETFKWIEIKETILRLCDFFKLNNLSIYKLYINNIPYQLSRLTSEPIYLKDEAKIRSLNIEFFKNSEKITESNENIILDLEDICQEMKDDGYVIKICSGDNSLMDLDGRPYTKPTFFAKVIIKPKKCGGHTFKYFDNINIIEDIDRMIDFMNSKGYNKYRIYADQDPIPNTNRLKNYMSDGSIPTSRIIVVWDKAYSHYVYPFNKDSTLFDFDYPSSGSPKNESKEEIVLDLKDICLELNDIGYNIDIQPSVISPPYSANNSLLKGFSHTHIEVIISKIKNGYCETLYDDVISYLERIIDYMKLQGYTKYNIYIVAKPYVERKPISIGYLKRLLSPYNIGNKTTLIKISLFQPDGTHPKSINYKYPIKEELLWPRFDQSIIDDIIEREEFNKQDTDYLQSYAKSNKTVITLIYKYRELLGLHNSIVREMKSRFKTQPTEKLLNKLRETSIKLRILKGELKNISKFKKSDTELKRIQKDLGWIFKTEKSE